MFKIFFLLGMLSIVLCSDYDNVFICRKSHYKTNDEAEEALNNINFHEVDAWVFTILGPLSLASGALIIITYILYP